MDVSNLLSAFDGLSNHFKKYEQIPQIQELYKDKNAIVEELYEQIKKKRIDEKTYSTICKRRKIKTWIIIGEIISEYYSAKYPLYTNNNQVKNSLNHTNNDLPTIDLFSDSMDIDMMHFLINQTNDQQINVNRR